MIQTLGGLNIKHWVDWEVKALSVAVIPGCEYYCVCGAVGGWVVGAGISYGWMVELYPSTLGQSLQHICSNCSWLTVLVDRCKRLSGYDGRHDRPFTQQKCNNFTQAYKGDIRDAAADLQRVVDRCLTDVRSGF